MRIRVTGQSEKCPNFLASRAVRFYVEKLIPQTISKKLYIHIKFTEEMDFHLQLGNLTTLDIPDYTRFRIKILPNLSEKESLMKLAHETVHIKQYATGEMIDLPQPDRVIWHSRRRKFANDGEDYWFSPWEVEAHGKEYGLYAAFAKSTFE